MTHRKILCDILRLFDDPSKEMSAEDVANRVIVEAPPSRFRLPVNLAKDLLKVLQKNLYLVVRRAKVNLYRLNPEDRRPKLPDGFLYEQRPTVRQTIQQWIVTPEWGGSGGEVALVSEPGGEASSSQVFYALTGPRGGGQLSEGEARKRLAILAQRHPALRVQHNEIVAPIANKAALLALAKLVSDASYRGGLLEQ